MPRLAGLQIMLNIALAARSRSVGRYWENFFIGRAEKGHPLCRWQVLETVRKLGLEGVVGKRIDSCYEPGERSEAPGSNSTRTWSRSSSSTVASQERTNSMPYSWEFTTGKNSSSSRR
jgi:hypothetical protein